MWGRNTPNLSVFPPHADRGEQVCQFAIHKNPLGCRQTDELAASEWVSLPGHICFCRRVLEKGIRDIALCFLEISGRIVQLM